MSNNTNADAGRSPRRQDSALIEDPNLVGNFHARREPDHPLVETRYRVHHAHAHREDTIDSTPPRPASLNYEDAPAPAPKRSDTDNSTVSDEKVGKAMLPDTKEMTAEPEEVVRPSPAPLQPTSSSSASSAQAYNHPQHHSQQQQVRDESEIFQLAHGRRKKPGSQDGAPAVSFIEVYDEQQPIRLSHLFRRPVIRQFLSDGRIYREKFERESSRFELFFDLCFVVSERSSHTT